MQTDHFKIARYKDTYRAQILSIWESSVRATHEFLTQRDFEEIKELVGLIGFNKLQVYCLIKENTVIGFIGAAHKKVEMLFLDPEYFGQGFGRKLLNYAVQKLQVNKVDVNEQNVQARKFYRRFGFKTIEKTEKDGQGKNYPLLKMKLT